ncbi:MAG: hypothetical protein ACW98Y_01460 [Candidatus Thorarchaeota archaeon]
MTTKDWDKVANKRRGEYTRHSTRVLLSMFTFSAWGITIMYGWFLGTHQGYAELYHVITSQWTLFNMSMIVGLIYFSLLVTVLYTTVRIYHRIRPL